MKEKENWIELLRVVSMFMVIGRHIVGALNMQELLGGGGQNYIIAIAMFLGGDIANSIFIITTGYLMYNKQFHIRRIVKLWFEVEFYSVFSYLVIIIMGIEKITLKSIIYAILPVGACTYWFFSTYFVMSFFFPLLNYIAQSLSKKKLKGILIIGLIFFSVLPTMGYGKNWLKPNENFPVFMFTLLYLLGGYIKKYNLHGIKRREISVLLFIIIGVVCIDSVPLYTIMGLYPLKFIWGLDRTAIVIMGGLLFFLFMRINVSDKIIVISRTVFGVYLFHNGPLLNLILRCLGLTSELYYTKEYIIYMLLGSITIFMISAVVDTVRIYTIEKVLMHITNSRINAINAKLLSWIDI